MFIADILFPKFCLGCGFLGSYLCQNCERQLVYLEKDLCIYCCRSSRWGLTHPLCGRENGLDGLMSLFHYNGLLKKIIETIKYRLATEVWKDFSLGISPQGLNKLSYFVRYPKKIYIEAIPLHPRRLDERGFNQSQLIADFFSKHISARRSNVLKREKTTRPQAQIHNKRERLNNVRGAFSVTNPFLVDGASFVLIDDVATSCFTLKEAAFVLKKAGAYRVFALTLARG